MLEALTDGDAVVRRRQPGERRNASRLLDLDLLLYADIENHSEFLTLPHPRMHLRAFVLLGCDEG